MNALEVYDLDYLPPEMMLDEHHPLNDDFIKSTALVQKRIMAQTKVLGAKATKAVKLHFKGQRHIDIAPTLGVTPATVGRYINSTDGKRLLALLHYYDVSLNGANQAQRRNILWRMVQDNEEIRPQVSLNAIKELNAMDPDLQSQNAGSGSTGPISITINQDLLPRGPLDS